MYPQLNEAAFAAISLQLSNVQAARNGIMQQTVQSYLTLSELDKRIHFAQRSVYRITEKSMNFKRRFEVGAGSLK